MNTTADIIRADTGGLLLACPQCGQRTLILADRDTSHLPVRARQRPKVAPVVVFALPLDGEQEVASDARFIVQFSKESIHSTEADPRPLKEKFLNSAFLADFRRLAQQTTRGCIVLERPDLLTLTFTDDVAFCRMLPERCGVAAIPAAQATATDP
jgi:hypothetical protein